MNRAETNKFQVNMLLMEFAGELIAEIRIKLHGKGEIEALPIIERYTDMIVKAIDQVEREFEYAN